MLQKRGNLLSKANISLSLQWALTPKQEPTQAARTALPRHFVLRCLRHALEPEIAQAEVGVRIVDADEGLLLNQQYRDKSYATNVLTFAYSPAPNLCADLVLCAPVVAQEALIQKISLQAHYAHLLVHGALHAQGFDHETSLQDAEAMEAKEVQILAGLDFASPYSS